MRGSVLCHAEVGRPPFPSLTPYTVPLDPKCRNSMLNFSSACADPFAVLRAGPEGRRYIRMCRPFAKFSDTTVRLFLLDTGSSSNLMSLKAAQESTKVHGDPNMHVQGLSGSVANVYSADKAVLQFGHLRQENQEMITFDLSHISDRVGTEISGVLGFTTLHLLEIQIDYRDGIVNFKYKPQP